MGDNPYGWRSDRGDYEWVAYKRPLWRRALIGLVWVSVLTVWFGLWFLLTMRLAS